MKPENLELAMKMGFHRRRTLQGLAEGIDWSSGSYGYDGCLEDLIQEVREQEQEKAEELVEALETIAEYWNQDTNHEAMADACYYMTDTAREILAKNKEQE